MSDTLQSPLAVHGCFFAVDVVQYRGRSEPEQKAVLCSVREILRLAVETLVPDGRNGLRWQWRGDGGLVVLPGTTDKATLFRDLLPAVERRLIEYNHRSADGYRYQVRAVVHCGDYGTAEDGLTGPEVVELFALLDSDGFREAVDVGNYAWPVILMVSDEYYQKVICRFLPASRQEFRKREINATDGKRVGWLWDPSGMRSGRDGGSAAGVRPKRTPRPPEGRVGGPEKARSNGGIDAADSEVWRSYEAQIAKMMDTLVVLSKQADEYAAALEATEKQLELEHEKVAGLRNLVKVLTGKFTLLEKLGTTEDGQ